MTDACIFCKIARKEIPADIVYEDDDVLAFKDINPAAPVHLLVIPKLHIAHLSASTDEHQMLLGRMLGVVPMLAKNAGCGVNLDDNNKVQGGYKTVINTGPAGGQEVYHLHIHILGGPRPWRGSL